MGNYFISYDLYKPGQDYDKVAAAIKQLGSWAKVHLSLYYVSSNLTQEQIFAHVATACDANDKLIVITATNASWKNLSSEVSDYIQNNWNS